MFQTGFEPTTCRLVGWVLVHSATTILLVFDSFFAICTTSDDWDYVLSREKGLCESLKRPVSLPWKIVWRVTFEIELSIKLFFSFWKNDISINNWNLEFRSDVKTFRKNVNSRNPFAKQEYWSSSTFIAALLLTFHRCELITTVFFVEREMRVSPFTYTAAWRDE